jgi:hypothetical protein
MICLKQPSPAELGLGMDGWRGRPEGPKEERWEWMVDEDGPKGRKRKAQSRACGAGKGSEGGKA